MNKYEAIDTQYHEMSGFLQEEGKHEKKETNDCLQFTKQNTNGNPPSCEYKCKIILTKLENRKLEV